LSTNKITCLCGSPGPLLICCDTKIKGDLCVVDQLKAGSPDDSSCTIIHEINGRTCPCSTPGGPVLFYLRLKVNGCQVIVPCYGAPESCGPPYNTCPNPCQS
jgi:hypothetical protein